MELVYMDGKKEPYTTLRTGSKHQSTRTVP